MDYSKYQYYQDVQLWPLTSEFNYKRWLENFEEGEDRQIAKHILDFFVYIPELHLDQMLKTVVGKCGYYFQKHDQNWSHESFINGCLYSFIPGDDKGFVHSGTFFTSKLRDKLDIPNENIVDPYTMVQRLVGAQKPLNVILVDDFVGTGAQCCEAWNELWKGQFGSISEIVDEKQHRVVYAPLVVNEMGKQAIEKYCKGLNLVYLHLLGPEYSLFNVDGLCWKGNHDLYDKWMDLHKRIVKKEGIPETDGASVVDAKGFCEQGLALAFKNGIPDACPAFFYWNSDTWKPLIKKHYQHGYKR